MFLKAEQIEKTFGKEKVLKKLNFELAHRQMLSILGRSGCGKTTLLKVIAGLEQTDAGQIFLDDRPMNDVPAYRRNIVYLYQEPLLFPHLNAFDNVAFGLRLRKEKESAIKAKTEEMLEQLGLSEQAGKMPGQLSGGQRQRVSFGRALIINPRMILLDEPFNALDTETRKNMQELLRSIAARFRITGIFVTHDLKEAILMGDRIALMEEGRLKVYPDKAAFIADADTGVRQEVEFWKGLFYSRQ
jgi:ABC-type Fe3+/spermidine/putrescine transport system ATPase subunit